MDNFSTHLKNILSRYDELLVLGKGASLVEHTLELESYVKEREADGKSVYLIGLNDVQSHIGNLEINLHLCNSRWSIESILEESLYSVKSKIVTHLDIKDKISKYGLETIKLDRPTENYRIKDNIINGDQPKNFNYLLFTAISYLKNNYSLEQSTTQSIKFLGFDFVDNTPDNYSTNIHEYNRQVFIEQNRILESLFDENVSWGHFRLRDMFTNPSLLLKTIDYENGISVMSNEQLIKANCERYNELMTKLKKDENYVAITAEFTNNHLGSIPRIKEMIALSKKSGADLVKFQKRNIDTFYTPEKLKEKYESGFGDTLEDYRRGVELDHLHMRVILEECERHEIPFFFSVLDEESLNWLKEYQVPLIKLPSTISRFKDYLSKVLTTVEEDIVISTGYTDTNYEKFLLEEIKKGPQNRNIFLLQCVSSYPTAAEDCNIAVVRHYNKLNNIFSGYSSHDPGSLGCMLAVAAGGRMIEKHVKLGVVPWVHFDSVAVDLLNGEFEEFVQDIRKAQLITGYPQKRISENEHHKYTK